MMKKSSLVFILLFTSIYANIKDDLANTYTRALSSIVLLTSEDIIASDHYKFSAFNATLDNSLLPFSYHFKNTSDTYNYYMYGSIGTSLYKENSIDFSRGTKDTVKLRTYALKLGGGVRYKTSSNTNMKLGMSYIYADVRGAFKSVKPLNTSASDDKAINDVFNRSQKHHSLELSSAFEYRPSINNYEPYVNIHIRHLTTLVDDTYTDIYTIKTIVSSLKVGVLTPTVTEVMGLPLKLEPYASIVFLSGDSDDVLGFNKMYVLGTTFRLKAHSLTSWVEENASLNKDALGWVEEVTLDVNLIKGRNIKGFKVQLGLKF